MHRRCPSQIAEGWPGRWRRRSCQRRSRRVLARDLPDTALRVALRCLTSHPSAASFTCSVAWVGWVAHGDVNSPSINGKDGVAGSIPAGGSTQPLTSANAGHLRVRGWLGRQLVVRFVSNSCRSAKDRNENAYLHNRWGSLRRASGIRGDEAPTSIGHTGGRDHRLGMRVPLPRFGRQ
jgi:hypothetical protein